MKKYQLTIVIEVKDDFNPAHINLLEHDVCDGLEVLLDHESDDFKLISFGLVDTKDITEPELATGRVTKEDIQGVAKLLRITLTDKELEWALLSYEDAQRQDPSGTWNLVVEDLCYQAVEFRGEPTEEPDMSRFHTDGDGDVNLNFLG